MNTDSLIWGLEELSDRELQQRLWTGEVDGEISSFTEAICSTFDDSGLGLILDSGQPTDQISAEAMLKAVQLDYVIKKIPQSVASLDIICHAAMEDVRTLGHVDKA